MVGGEEIMDFQYGEDSYNLHVGGVFRCSQPDYS